ncbi:Uncharacterised protein [Mycobacteroides abscessus subsp. massiliense]|uniref:DUF2383 domain-containing protein n=2 Tax=Mycobacteroides abscessus TaxID=36809 RepID=X8DQ41_9MYCO|nr:hypothetical protein [Mycobacteroides abscessus]EUA70524.1 hypothetical protein I540_2519 [Mycobacteroides abscessus subsp. bolletii 1513]EHM17887.1 hypothetical protein MMAS_23460 [Mycobacteroides abscessus subsp. massiliense CCUG 48898 = JCM 15300]EIU12514.1 hypothetical protein MA5S0304_1409 [Mycobacteroides abscessus 5S-0304]EIU14230.1 hypothetical protein MA5S0421_1661 [Mycobacteroides abscessus 5S-0421]EIU15101.1 hypothetical protein MA5S0422_2342 [Mycobacteroides abscessus 5S-0422]
MTLATESGELTGTKDKNYDLIRFTKDCLENALRLQTFISDAERDGDTEVAQLFRKAQSDSRKSAELAKTLLSSRL